MADPQAWFKGVMVFAGYNRGWSESFFLAGNNIDSNTKMFKNLSRLRGCLLAKGFQLRYSSISQIGPDRPAWATVAHPIDGLTGVNLDTTKWTDNDIAVNNPSTSVRYRLETETGRNRMVQIRGVPDGIVSAFKYKYQDETTDAGPTPSAGPFDATSTLVFPDLMWDRTTEPTTASTPPSTDYVTWKTALRDYLGYLRDCTVWAHLELDDTITSSSSTAPVPGVYTTTTPTYPSDGVANIASFGKFTWNYWKNVYYRGISELHTGRPSLR